MRRDTRPLRTPRPFHLCSGLAAIPIQSTLEMRIGSRTAANAMVARAKLKNGLYTEVLPVQGLVGLRTKS